MCFSVLTDAGTETDTQLPLEVAVGELRQLLEFHPGRVLVLSLGWMDTLRRAVVKCGGPYQYGLECVDRMHKNPHEEHDNGCAAYTCPQTWYCV